ncbi:hypothetical protein GDO81_027126 [Engystomops pustulosus]|uniref:Uncharacterized protein n=1 Tax=Engystomops pustulosus TaxID=76066 RepID=A0AAV6Z4L4_ENGPU|nr:hypothetical protein GDO81_027126 [Engystomops pustulosus]
MDFITNLPPSSGITVIWVVINSFSKMSHFFLCKICHLLHVLPASSSVTSSVSMDFPSTSSLTEGFSSFLNSGVPSATNFK